jgi:hypothetical protein
MSYAISYIIDTLYTMITILHSGLVQFIHNLSIPVLQAVGRLGRKRGKEDIDIHLLKRARFAVDPVYAIPPTMSANTVQAVSNEAALRAQACTA